MLSNSKAKAATIRKRISRAQSGSLCVGLFAPLLVGNVAAADGEASASGAAATSAITESASLEEVLVTARKRVENVQDVPISVAVMTADQLNTAQVGNMAELSAVSPSINFQGSHIPANVNFSIRGVGAFAPQAGIQPAVSVVIDEVPLSRQGEFSIDTSDITSLEILSGPQGTLFGTNTTGGAVNIRTAQPTDSFEGYVEATATDDEEFGGRAMVSGPLTSNLRARALVAGKDRRGLYKNYFPGAPRSGGDESYGANLKFDYDVSDSINLKFGGDYRRQSGDSVIKTLVAEPGAVGAARLTALGNGDPALGQRILDDRFAVNTDIDNFSEYQNWGVFSNLTWDISDDLTFKSISSYRDFDMDFTLDIDRTPASLANTYGLPIVSAVRTNLAYDQDAPVINEATYFSQEFRLAHSAGMLDWTVGAFYLHHDELFVAEAPLLMNNATVLLDQPRMANLELRTWSVFGDATWHITDSVDVFAGGRWTQEDLRNAYSRRDYAVPRALFTQSGDMIVVDPSVAPLRTVTFDAETTPGEWSGRAGIAWHVTPDINLYGTASRGYTGAGSNTSTPATGANPFVFPSIAHSYEVGAKSTLLEDRLRLNMALFWMKVENLQATIVFANLAQGVQTFNAGNLVSKGAEVSATALLTDRLVVSGSLTLLDTALEDLIQPCYRGQTAAQGCGDFNADGVPDQNLEGQPGFNAPETKFNVSATYRQPLDGLPFDAHATVAYTWQSEVAFNFLYDPIATYQDAYGLLDFTIGIEDKNGRYNISLFGKNVLDEHFSTSLFDLSNTTGRVATVDPRGSHAYYGLKTTFNF